ncbi:juvenile hormone esterase isoform X2 [Procambarus clarkii]|uniref:juvenile hormone esterase isoform X2 n=1 Tax=Procambarus clarkii TaxID=6728 RepID=UPI001E67098F|nr:juvenile hormone esterase-like isoform X2 [Procambarus clarkii]
MRLRVVVSVVLSMWAEVVAGEAPLVTTHEGRVAGVIEASTKGRVFYSYYGLPYAKPPLGPLRLKDPAPVEPWEGVRDGSRLPEMCLQVPFGDTVAGVRLPPEGLSGSEDCLYLNVFTPREPAGLRDQPAGLRDQPAGLPVMVYIHGGGFFSGGTNEYLPHALLNHDIVLVVLQYRLGTLGFLSTEDSVIPGNFGLKDQTLALQWVQRNIHHFGGDKTKVTIFGQSAGGASVHYHMLSPKSDGLFARAIMQSGTSLSPWALARTHRTQAQYVAAALGCPTQRASQAILQCLQDSDGRSLAALAHDFFKWSILPMTVTPRVDGDFLQEEPGLLVREGRFRKVELMAGSVREEGAMFTHAMLTNKELVSALKSNFSEIAPVTLQCEGESADPVALARSIFTYYLGDQELEPVARSDQLTKMFSDRLVSVDVEQVVKHQAKFTSTYRYVLTHRGHLSFSDVFPTDVGSHWVSHCDDLLYLFRADSILKLPHDLQDHVDLHLRDTITSLWTNFAATGNPTPDDSLGFTWRPSTEDNLQYLALTPNPTMEADLRHEVRRFHASLPTTMNQALHPQLVGNHDQLPAGVVEASSDGDNGRDEL